MVQKPARYIGCEDGQEPLPVPLSAVDAEATIASRAAARAP